jgi:Macrocin-O-methyltransferase (TylF)
MAMTTVLDEVRARIPGVRGQVLRPFVRFREMRIPTFRAEIHESIAISDDYFRYATLGLAVTRVLDEGVSGAFAEVGVWRGETSAFLNRLAPHRQLYLLATFSGFSQSDLPQGATDNRFRDTSKEAVRRRVGPADLVMHDYNNAGSGWACKRAMDGFLRDRPERLIELGDVRGSVLIRRVG